MTEPVPGVLIGSGRSCDVYDIGNDRVLRRSRVGQSGDAEALTMHHVRQHGYPAPEVFDVDGADIVMQHVRGRTMLQAFGRTPWKARHWARVIGDLVTRLAAVPLPRHELPRHFGSGDKLAHCDLHPMNIMLTAEGPVVIDWADAAVAPAGADAAVTWITMASGEIEGPALLRMLGGLARNQLVHTYVDCIDRPAAQAQLRAAFDYRAAGSNIRPAEVARMRAFLDSMS